MSWIITGTEKYETDPYRSQVSLLLHGDGTNGSTTIVDSSPTPKTVTAFGNAQISTAQSKFGGSTIAFDGNGDYLRLPQDSSLAMRSGSFTIEMWLYINALTTNAHIFGQQSEDFTLQESVGTGQLIIYDGSSRNLGAPPLSEWFHFALVRNGSTLQAYYNGQASGSSWTNASETRFTLSNAWIGSRWGATFFFDGYIDDLRITKGVARYTSNFTPPTAPFPDI